MFRFGTGFGLLNCPLSEFNGEYNKEDFEGEEWVCVEEYDENAWTTVRKYKRVSKKLDGAKYSNVKNLSKKDLIKQKYLEKSSEL